MPIEMSEQDSDAAMEEAVRMLDQHQDAESLKKFYAHQQAVFSILTAFIAHSVTPGTPVQTVDYILARVRANAVVVLKKAAETAALLKGRKA